uniref:5'-nucleotidase domain-containing protein 3 n=1 Tax=Timema bartmani TaxID=61472 RepID=A0A7R9F2X5_9NEOP|nr:unnamed protein product [Timema bartmani]
MKVSFRRNVALFAWRESGKPFWKNYPQYIQPGLEPHPYRPKKLPPDVNIEAVFACNELDLKEVNVYGFDYDYTLACYKPSMDYLLYNLGRDTLVKKLKYPDSISKLDYRPGFAVRGLHYDIEKGLLLKIDSFLQIQLGSVYRGLSPVPNEEVLRLYRNKTIPIDYVESHGRHQPAFVKLKMIQLADLFSVPEMGLLCNVAEYFEKNHIEYHPEILFRDVKKSVQSSHSIMHNIVENNVTDYLEQNSTIQTYFEGLIKAGKKLFLVTNSPFRDQDAHRRGPEAKMVGGKYVGVRWQLPSKLDSSMCDVGACGLWPVGPAFEIA